MTANDESKDQTLKKNPTDDEDITFYFFYDIVKQLILKRNDIGDACVLSTWLKVLEQNTNKTVRNEYIRLMILALQYAEPICPFKDAPPETIDPLEDGVIEMSRKFLKKEGTATCIGDNENIGKHTYPTMNTAVSYDKHQYASYQVIPNVGVQCYYANSDEPMYDWALPSQIAVPKSGPLATDIEWERAIAGIQPISYKPSTDNLQLPNTQKNATAKDDENEVKSSISGSKVSKTRNYQRRKKEQQQQQQQQQPLVHDGGGCGGCGGEKKKKRECPRPKLCTIRQSAGHGNVKPPAEERRPAVVEKSPLDHHRRRISELTLKLAELISTDSRTSINKSRDSAAGPPARRPAPGPGGRGADDDCGGATPAPSTESRAERQLNSGLLFKRSELRSMLDFTSECFEEVTSMLRRPRKDPAQTVSLAQLYGRSAANSRDGESDA